MAIKNLQDVWDWAGVAGAVVEQFVAVVGDVKLVRELALVSRDDVQAVVDQLVVGGLSIVNKGRLVSAWRCAQIMVGINPDQEQQDRAAAAKMDSDN